MWWITPTDELQLQGDLPIPPGVAGLRRFLHRHGITLIKSAYASEQDRADVLKRREDLFECQLELDLNRLVFIDETWASTKRGAQARSLSER